MGQSNSIPLFQSPTLLKGYVFLLWIQVFYMGEMSSLFSELKIENVNWNWFGDIFVSREKITHTGKKRIFSLMWQTWNKLNEWVSTSHMVLIITFEAMVSILWPYPFNLHCSITAQVSRCISQILYRNRKTVARCKCMHVMKGK